MSDPDIYSVADQVCESCPVRLLLMELLDALGRVPVDPRYARELEDVRAYFGEDTE